MRQNKTNRLAAIAFLVAGCVFFGMAALWQTDTTTRWLCFGAGLCEWISGICFLCVYLKNKRAKAREQEKRRRP